MKRYIIIFTALFTSLLWSCEPEALKDPIDGDGNTPGQVSNIQVKNIAGGATISYDIPYDRNLLYVMAEYTLRDGTVKQVKASYYENSVTVEGFPNTDPRTIKLYAVSRNEKPSGPVEVTINPLTPPVQATFETLKLEATFGGVRLYFDNDAEANLSLTILGINDKGEWEPAQTYYTKSIRGTFAARGFEPEKQRFAAYVRDRWNNLSDTLYGEYTPLPEQLLDKTKFKKVQLLTDTYDPHTGQGDMTSLWDGKWNGAGKAFHTRPGTGLPQWFTFDMGVSAKLSRFKVYHRKGGGQGAFDGAYTGGDPKEFELYGSNDPATDGSWDSWTLIGTFKSRKPSLSPDRVVTDEDYQYAVVNGEEYDILEGGDTPYRYIRFKTNRVWGSLDHMYMEELTFWGDLPGDNETPQP